MRKNAFGISLGIALAVTGCANSQLQQSLLLHENRQLEDALFVAHAQVADLKRENNSLRKQQTSSSHEQPSRQPTDWWDNEWSEPIEAPLEIPRVILPNESGTTEVPEWMRGSQTMPIWQPVR
jgi:hypothetical protein